MKHKLKRLICIAVALTMTGQLLPDLLLREKPSLIASAEDPESTVTIDGITYDIYSDHAVVLSADETLKNADIQSEVNGKPVTEIGKKAFYCYVNLESVHIPNSVKEIGANAFYGCYGLTQINIPDSVEKLHVDAFLKAKIETLVIGKNLEYIFEQAIDMTNLKSVTVDPENPYYEFKNSGLYSKDGKRLVCVLGDTTEYEIPDGVEDISGAFYYNNNLKRVSVPGSVQNNGRAFYYCKGLTDVTLSDGMEIIGQGCFAGCKSLKSIILPETIQALQYESFYDCSKLESITLPKNVRTVGYAVFEYCNQLSSITFMNPQCSIDRNMCNMFGSLRYQGTIYGYDGSTAETFAKENGYTFNELADSVVTVDGITYGIYSDHAEVQSADETLKNADIQSEVNGMPVTVIGKNAFRKHIDLESVHIPDSVKEIDDYAFNECSGLTQISIPDSVTHIRFAAFSFCEKLTELTIPDSVEVIKPCAFIDCPIQNLVIGKNVQKIGIRAFIPQKLTSITVDPENAYYEFKNSGLYSKDGKCLLLVMPDITEYEIPEGIEDISGAFAGNKKLKKVTVPGSVYGTDNAFFSCSALTDVTLSEGVKAIEQFCFANCVSLKDVRLPDSVQYVGRTAFGDCRRMENIILPASVRKVDESVFYKCSVLSSITFMNPQCSIDRDIFGESEYSGSITGYTGSTAEAFANENGFPFRSLGEFEDPKNLQDGESISYSLNGINYKVYNDHAEMVGINGNAVGSSHLFVLEEVWGQPVTIIASNVASNAKSWLTAIDLPDSVTEIQNSAFSGCSKLKSVKFPANLQTLRYGAFMESGLESAELPDSLSIIGDMAFYGCSSLKNVSLPDNLQQLGCDAFAECGLKGAVTIPANCQSIDLGAFVSCPGLTAINVSPLNEYYTSSYGVLYNKQMTELYQIPGGYSDTSYYLPDSVTKIHKEAVSRCNNLVYFNISENSQLRVIDDYAFSESTSLKTIRIPDTVTSLGSGAFMDCKGLFSVRLSANIGRISSWTFQNCMNLREIVFPPSISSLTAIGNSILQNTPALERIVILNPEAKIESESGNNLFGDIDTYGDYQGAIYGYSGSTAEAFADKYAYEFIDLETMDEYVLDGIKYSFDSGDCARVCGYEPGITRANIPAEVLGLPVTVISGAVFVNCDSLKSLTLPETMKLIGFNAFLNCTSLQGTVRIPDSVERIYKNAFAGCSGVTDFDFGASVSGNPNSKLQTIDSGAFSGCTGVQFINLPSSVKTIGDNAFEGCTNLFTMSCGTGVETIGTGAFANCKKLNIIDWGNNLKTLGANAFENCYSLTIAALPETCESIGEDAFSGCSDSSFCILFYNTETEIPDAATTAFAGTILGYPNSTAQAYAKKYGYAFRSLLGEENTIERNGITYKLYDDHAEVIGCKDTLQEAEIIGIIIDLPVTVIAEEAFKNKTSLKSVIMPDEISMISTRAFAGCSNLSSVEFGGDLEEIGSGAFMKTNLSNVELPECLLKIDDSAFSSISSLEQITLGERLAELGLKVTSLSNSLKSVSVSEDNKSFVFDENDNILFSADKTRICIVPNQRKGEGKYWSYSIPDSVTDIRYAFRGLTLATSVTIPDSVTENEAAFQGCTGLAQAAVSTPEIDKYMFEMCSNLQMLWLENTKTVEEAAFRSCTALEWVKLPGTCEKLNDYAFGNCPALKKIVFYNPECVISSKIFAAGGSPEDDVPFTGTICGYEGSTAQTFAEENGYSFESLGKFYGYLVYRVKDGQITITDYLSDIPETAEIPAEIEGLPVTSISYCAFYDCYQLKEIQLPDTLKTIEKEAFSHTGLERVTIPESIETIENYTFYMCKSLKNITIPDTVKTIGEYAFEECDALTEITIPDTVELIGQASFDHNPNLEKITVGAKTISKCSFSSNPKLKEVILTEGVEIVDESAFGRDFVLETVEFPASVKSIGAKQFIEATAMNAGGTVIIRNPECVLDDNMLTSDFMGTVYGYLNSTAQTYCEAHHFKFAAICNVSFDGNGAKGEMEGGEFFGEITLPECGFTAPTGKKFAGWTTGENGIVYPAGTVLPLTDDTVLKANWQTATVTVTLDANGGTGTAVKSSVVSGSAFTFPTCSFTAPEGKQFAGWQLGEKTYQPGDSIKVTKNNTVKALWEDIQYTVFFDANGGSGAMESKNVLMNAEFTLPENAFTAPENSEFLGWVVNKKNYEPGDKVVISEDTTILALWSEPVETVLVGDVSGDGKVDQADAILLARYAAAWEGIELDLRAADLNNDGTIDNADAMILARYVAGWADYDKYIVSKTI